MLCLANTKRPAQRRALFKLRGQHLKTPRGSGTWEHLRGPGRVDAGPPVPPPGAPEGRAAPPETARAGVGGRAARASPPSHPGCPGHRNCFQAPAFPLKIRGTSGGPLASPLCFKWPRSSLDTEFRSLRTGLGDAPGALTSAARAGHQGLQRLALAQV